MTHQRTARGADNGGHFQYENNKSKSELQAQPGKKRKKRRIQGGFGSELTLAKAMGFLLGFGRIKKWGTEMGNKKSPFACVRD